MITLEEALIMGTNAPKPHQRIIGRLMIELGILYYKQGSIHLEPMPETMLNEDQTSPTPDTILFDNVLAKTPVIIEVTHTTGVTGDCKKIRRLIDEDDYGIEEGFVYDYKANEWHKYYRDKGDLSDNPSLCEAINLDLAPLL